MGKIYIDCHGNILNPKIRMWKHITKTAKIMSIQKINLKEAQRNAQKGIKDARNT